LARLLAALLLAAVSACPALGLAEEAQGFRQALENGAIDWQSGQVTAVGIGAPPATAANEAQARGLALRAATVVARRNLLEIIRGVQIDSRTTVENYLVARDVVVSQIRGSLQNSQILDTAYMSDGSVEVTVGLPLRGNFADLLLPRGGGAGRRSATALDAEAPAEAPATGLVVNARGLGARPALSPRLLDRSGNVLYGAAGVSRQWAVSQGMAGYARDPGSAAARERIGAGPLEVTAIQAAGAAATDLVLGDDDADRVRALAASGDVLGECRVLIVLD